MRRIAGAALALTVLVGCAGPKPGEARPVADPRAVVADALIPAERRVEALQQGWARGEFTRDELKQIVWDGTWPPPVRAQAAAYVVAQEGYEEDSRSFIGYRLPTETSLQTVEVLCAAAAERGWVETTPALVRSYSRPVKGVDDAARPERRALETLHPDKPLEDVAFEVFMRPQVDGDDETALKARDRTRRDAWALLARLDPDGATRTRLIEAEPDTSDPLVAAVRDGALELGAIPVSGEELFWLERLHATRSLPDGWWASAQRAVAALDDEQRTGLRLRHLQPLVWAQANAPSLLESSRDALLETLRSRDAQRTHNRVASLHSWSGPTRDRLGEWEESLSWADMLTIIVVDDAIRGTLVTQMLFAQADMDHVDDTTEYGGLLVTDDEGRFSARLYEPRPSARMSDYQFIAPAQMHEEGDLAFADYHFHVQDQRNGAYAGPSDGDVEYASRHGRTCLVLTSIKKDVLGVDLYQPSGAIIDLGEIRR